MPLQANHVGFWHGLHELQPYCINNGGHLFAIHEKEVKWGAGYFDHRACETSVRYREERIASPISNLGDRRGQTGTCLSKCCQENSCALARGRCRDQRSIVLDGMQGSA